MDLRKCENQWVALQVRSRHEPRCAQLLRAKGYEEFLPLCVHPLGDSYKRSSVRRGPLFPGYIFCRLSSKALGPIVTTPWVIRIVGCGGDPAPISDQEVNDIRRIVESGHFTYPWPNAPIGQRICIVEGPLRGVTGTLLRTKNVSRLIVTVDLLQRSAAVEIDARSVSVLLHEEPMNRFAETRSVMYVLPGSRSVD